MARCVQNSLANVPTNSSELPIVDVGCGEVPEPISGRRRCFEAPSTCKQLTPQITAICDGAQENTMLYLNTHATCANAPERYLAHTPAKIRAQNRHPVSVHCIEGAPAHQSTPQCHKAARGQLTRQCYRTPLIGIEGVVVAAGHLRSVGGIRPAQTEMIHVRVDPRESMHAARQFISRAETCKQSFRGAVLVHYTCPDVPLTGVVGG